MKRIILTIALIATVALSASAQRTAYVDMEYILGKLQAYKDAQAVLDQKAETWRAEIDAKMTEVENAYKSFQAEQVLMTESVKEQKIAEIENLERQVKEMQKAKFGPEGELFEAREDLIKPIQDDIYEQIKIMAEDKSYDFVFDKSSGKMLYSNEKYDKSDEILQSLQ